MNTLYPYYVRDLDGTLKYFKDLRQANDFAQDVANTSRQSTARYDIHGGMSLFYPKH